MISRESFCRLKFPLFLCPDFAYFLEPLFDLIGIGLKYGVRGIKLLLAKKKAEKELLEQQKQALLDETTVKAVS